MQNEERELVQNLIKAGFWNTDDKNTSLQDERVLGLLLERVERCLIKNVFFCIYGPSYNRTGYEMRLVWPRGKCLLGTGSSLSQVIGNAALALPSFLRDHPECARRET